MLDFDGSQETDFDTNMTLQVALKGNDGFVIASDTKSSSSFGTSITEKMFLKNSIVWAFSGYTALVRLGRKLELVETAVSLGSMEEAADKALLDFPSVQKPSLNGRLIFACPAWKTFRQVTVSAGVAFAIEVNPAFGGDFSNLACYLSERFYSPGKSVDELAFLAAHVVVEGALINPSEIGGLDVVVSKDGSLPRRLTKCELQSLTTRSESIYHKLENAIFYGDEMIPHAR